MHCALTVHWDDNPAPVTAWSCWLALLRSGLWRGLLVPDCDIAGQEVRAEQLLARAGLSDYLQSVRGARGGLASQPGGGDTMEYPVQSEPINPILVLHLLFGARLDSILVKMYEITNDLRLRSI